MKKSLVAVFMMAGMFTYAQVTTSLVTGTIRDENNRPVNGGNVVLVHEPSGTRYVARTNSEGVYTLPNVRVGGPFRIVVTAPGKGEVRQSDIFTSLGNSSTVDLVIGGASSRVSSLQEVRVTATRNPIINSKSTGASSTLGREAVNRIPTIGRTVNDVTKYNPYSNGRSFGGQDPRFNNFTIDGAVFNNGFGLGNQAQAGGRTGSGAISLDAIEEIQINVAPFDVKQSGFAGAAINAVTRSGNNNFSGSVFSFWNNDGLTGKKAYGEPIQVSRFNTETRGFRLGGPVVKNKLFFFFNAEVSDRTDPALSYVASRPGAVGNISRTTYADLVDLRDFMRRELNYDLGEIDGYNNTSFSRKYLGRLDWNINDQHKLTLRYSHHDSQSDQIISNSNSSNTAGNGNRQNRLNALSGQNTGYGIQDNTRSYVAELNSTFRNGVSNQFIATYNKQIEDRSYRTPSIFPTIDILKDGQTYTSLGMDPFTPNNRLNYSTLNVTNNTNILLGRHTLTAGLSYERFDSNNLFVPASNGVWTFNSIEDFKQAVLDYKANPNQPTSNVPLNRFNYRYSRLAGGQEPWQRLKINTFSAYLQDAWKATPSFNLYYGLRLDYVDVLNTSQDYVNTYAAGLTFYRPDGSPYKVKTDEMPKGKLYLSPRFGFNWDASGNRSTQLRGGTGVFLSRLPYVLISNQLGNNGVNLGLINATGADAAKYPFTLDPSRYTPVASDPASLRGYNINYTDPDLKFPQIWRSSLAIDQKLPFGGLVATLEGIYNKNINALGYEDVNLRAPNGNFTGTGDTRAYYPSLTKNSNSYNDGVKNVFVLTNNSQGYSYSLTAKLEKPITNWGGMIAYTNAVVKDITSVGATVNANTPTTTGQNYLQLSYGDSDLRHRIIGTLSYRTNYGERIFGGATTFTLGMVSNSGFKYSYTAGRDLNGDGQINDLIYVPTNASDIRFEDVMDRKTKAVIYTAQQQAEAFDNFIKSSPYLSSRRGQYAERNGAETPWLTRFDLGIEQDIIGRFGFDSKPHTIKLRVDIMNVGNLLNDKWGVSERFTTNQPITPVEKRSADGAPIYQMATQKDSNGKDILLRDAFQRNLTIGDVWQIQVGLRYTFGN